MLSTEGSTEQKQLLTMILEEIKNKKVGSAVRRYISIIILQFNIFMVIFVSPKINIIGYNTV